MSTSTPSTAPSRQPGYGCSLYHQNIFAALVRAWENYKEVWRDMEERCKPHGFDMKLAAGFDEIEEAAIPVILLAHAMVEALANWYLAMSLPPDRFRQIERKGVVRKWTEFIKECIPGYDLPSEHQVSWDLEDLIARRVAITHHKPLIEANNQEVHPGDHRAMVTADHEFVTRVASLPARLLDHLRQFDDTTHVHVTRFNLDETEGTVLRRLGRTRARVK